MPKDILDLTEDIATFRTELEDVRERIDEMSGMGSLNRKANDALEAAQIALQSVANGLEECLRDLCRKAGAE